MNQGRRTARHDHSRIFDLLRDYHRSRENIRLLINMTDMSDYEKIGFIDAWQEEMADYFASNGYCFACNRPFARCDCVEPIRDPGGFAGR